MKLITHLFVISLFMYSEVTGQATGCSSAESSQFDFWMGSWNLSWNDTSKGTNIITKDLDGCVICEHFSSSSNQFRGNSWSVWNPNTNQWQQTWVDNTAGYIVLSGGIQNGNMVLQTAEKSNDKGSIIYRMIYYNITPNAFDWNWESSDDHGKTWTSKWKIHYARNV